MSGWQKLKIGDVLKRIKRPIVLEDHKEYKLVTVKLHHKGVELREYKKGCDIGSKMYEAKSGDFILSGIDARNGAFGIVGEDLDGAIVTNDFWYFELNKELIDKHFFLELTSTQWFDEICRFGSDGTTQRIRLQKDRFFNQDIYLPSIEKQRDFSKRFLLLKAKKQKLNEQNNFQKAHLNLLRQQILQDAISGKLTADWRVENPDTEPASKLLGQIKTEKEKLIAENKLKKEKTLPMISGNEVPFELPEGWEWCRLGEMLQKIHYGFTASAKPKMTDIRLLRITDIQDNCVDWENVPGCEFKQSDLGKYLLNENDILIARTGGTIGKTYIVKKLSVKSLFASYLIRAIPSKNLSADFIKLLLESPMYWKQLQQAAWGAGQPNVNAKSLSRLIFPLPPRAEQRAIVAKVERLMGYVSQLEEKIANNANNAEILMRTFLGEFFQEVTTKS